MSSNRSGDAQPDLSGVVQDVAQNTQTNESNKTNPRRNTSRRRKPPAIKKTSWDISQFAVPEAEDKTRFHDLGLVDPLMHAIQDLGFQYCSPIQAKILPQTLKGLDAIGKAQTGTGKTAAFLISLINDMLTHPLTQKRYLGEPRALIVAPTRELVMQIATDARDLCKHTGLHVVTLVGGMDYGKQRKSMLSKLTDIVVATPGRLIDCMTRNDIHLDMVESLVLDEADRMLDMGFIPQVRRIVRTTPNYEIRQTQLFSATFNSSILNLAEQWTYEAIHVEIETDAVAANTVEQKVYMVSNEEKFTVFKNILKLPETKRVIVFTNRRDQTQTLYEKLHKAGFNVSNLSGEVAQHKRSRTLAEFKSGKIEILVATDVMGRGIHIDNITHVINYNLPDNPEDYVHRIGRTGRAGVLGTAISLACEYEAFQLPAIEELLGEKLKCELPPENLFK